MKITRKLLSVILALIMMVNVFAICSFANEVGGNFANGDTLVHYTIETDKASYEKGDIVTFTVKIQTLAEVGTINLMSQICYGYDSSVLEPLATTETMADHGFVPGSAFETGYVSATSKVWDYETLVNNNVTLEPANNWDKMIGIVADCNECMVDASAEPVVMYTFQMRVKADTTATSTVFGVNDNCYDDWWGFQNSVKGDLYAQDAAGIGYSATYVYDGDIVELTIGTPVPAGPVVAKAGAQVKFTPDATTANKVADKFQFRVKSVISASDWNTYFANTTDAAATTNTLTAVGLVAFPATEEFSADKANAAIAAIGDKEYTGSYKAASTNHIQKAEGDNTDAYFGAIINISHENCPSDIRYIGFAQYKDGNGDPQIIFYNAYETALVTGDAYDTLVNTYKDTYKDMFPA